MIFNLSGGGGSGATLTVSSPAGVTVTVTNSDESKTYERIASEEGTAVFKGLDTGWWMVEISDGVNNPTRKPVNIVADYTLTIAFFAATINVTYPSGSTCTATDGVTTISAPDTGGSWECVVPNAGTWTVTTTDGTSTKSKQVEITADGQSESISISYTYWIFNQGNTVDYTGGWGGSGDYTGNALSVSNGSNSGWISNKNIYSANKIDMSSYSVLHFVVSSYNNSSAFGLSDNTDNGDYSAAKVSVTAVKEYTIDISALTGSYYVKLGSTGKQASGSTWTSIGYAANKIWLE